MTLALRNTILRGTLAITVVLLGIYAVALYQLLVVHPGLSLEFTGTRMVRLLAGSRVGAELMGYGVRTLVATVGVLGVFTTVWFAIMIRRFRKRTAPEVFFFLMFFATVSLDLVKPVVMLAVGLPVAFIYANALTRLLYFGYVLGIFCLFASSLANSVIDSKRTGTVFSLSAAVAVAFVYLVPVDATQLYPSLLHRIGLEDTAHATVGAISALAVVNYLHTGISSTDREYVILGVAVALAVAGRHLVFHVPHPLALIPGAVCYVAGVLIFGRRSHQRYLWQ